MSSNPTASKKISAGTLGLRFMQNALRAKQIKEVMVEKAPVKDDGEWEIDQKIRDTWSSVSSLSSHTVTQESSYLPFLFSSEASTSSEFSDKPRGRRAFNKHGFEETQTEKEAEPTPPTTGDDHERSKVHPRPKSISSGFGSLSGFPDRSPPKAMKNAKTAKQAIYDNAGVGEDLRRSKQKLSTSTSAPPMNAKPVFLKPAGVDDPLDAERTTAASLDTASDIIQGARSKTTKRERPSAEQPAGEESKRKRKKRKSTP